MKRQAKVPPILAGQGTLCDPGGTNVLPANLQVMHHIYGVDDTHRCGDCQHFQRYRQSARWAKCDLTVDSGGPGSDWGARWTACQRFADSRD
jgi:hypothetical protein